MKKKEAINLECEALKAERDTLARTCGELSKNIDRIREESKKELTLLGGLLEKTRDESLKQLDLMQAERERIISERDKARFAQKQAEEAGVREHAALIRERDEAKRVAEIARKERDTLAGEVADLRQQLLAKPGEGGKSSSAAATRDDLRNQVDALEIELAEARAVIEQFAREKTDAARVQGDMASLTTARDEAVQANLALAAELEQMRISHNKHLDSVSALSSRGEAEQLEFGGTVSALRKQRPGALSKREKEHAQALESLAAERDLATEKVKVLDVEISRLRESAAKFEADLRQTRESGSREIAALAKARDEAATALAREKDAILKVMAERDQALQQIREHEAARMASEQKLGSAEKSLAIAHSGSSEQVKSLAAAKTALEFKLVTETEARAKAVQVLTNERDQILRSREDLSNKLKETETLFTRQLAEMRQERDGFQRQIEGLNQQVAKLRDEQGRQASVASSQREALARSRDEMVAQLTRENGTLKDQLKQLGGEREKVKIELAAAQAEIRRQTDAFALAREEAQAQMTRLREENERKLVLGIQQQQLQLKQKDEQNVRVEEARRQLEKRLGSLVAEKAGVLRERDLLRLRIGALEREKEQVLRRAEQTGAEDIEVLSKQVQLLGRERETLASERNKAMADLKAAIAGRQGQLEVFGREYRALAEERDQALARLEEVERLGRQQTALLTAQRDAARRERDEALTRPAASP